MRNDFGAFLRFWILQGLTVFIVMLAPLSLWQSSSTSLNTTSLLGLGVFLLGLALETIADNQKSKFNKSNLTKSWIDVGVWRSSRHPNYLGEMMVWLGMYFFAFPSLVGKSALIAFGSPLYVILLLVFVSGIPIVEKAADKKWGNDKNYQKYKKEVPVLIPTPTSILRTKLYHA